MTLRFHTPLVLAIALAPVAAAPVALAQTAVAPVGTPARISSFEAIADVRAFAVARASDRALVAYVGGEGRFRGVVRTALLHALPGGAGLERVGSDHTLAAYGTAVALTWDGTQGAVVYIVPRPHRGQPTGQGRRRHTPQETEAAVAHPLGVSALTAADVVFQRVDATGAPVGRPTVLFEENSRTFRAAVVPVGTGWVVAWTGAISVDGEVQATVRTMHLDAAGTARPYASDTGFTGQVGDGLALFPRGGTRQHSLLVWSGERCRTREDLAPHRAPEGDPSEGIERRDRTLRNQEGPHEHPGPPVVCGSLGMFSAELHADGTTGPIIEGPALAADAVAVVRGAGGEPLALASIGEHVPSATLAAMPLDAAGRPGRVRVVTGGTASPRAASAPVAGSSATPASTSTASAVPPPPAPDAAGIVRAPAMLEAASEGANLSFAALSPTRARVVYGTQALSGSGAPELVLVAPGVRTWAVAIAAAQGSAPWLFAQTGNVWNGPLVFVDGATAAAHVAAPEVPWAGDETFRTLLLRAQLARAEYTRAEGTWGPLSEREDAATNPNLPAMASVMRSRRMRWDAACSPLIDRARSLVRRGAGNDLNDLARQVCEIPVEPTVPVAGAVPPTPAP